MDQKIKRSEFPARLDEINRLRDILRRSKSFEEMDFALIQRISDINNGPWDTENRIEHVLNDVVEEYNRVGALHGPYKSLHHGESVIREEFEELWEEVKKRPTNRDKGNMRRECIQIASAALHFITDLLEGK